MFVQWIVMKKNSYKNFRLASLAFYFILKYVLALILDQIEVFWATLAVLFYTFHKNSFPYQKYHGGKSG